MRARLYATLADLTDAAQIPALSQQWKDAKADAPAILALYESWLYDCLCASQGATILNGDFRAQIAKQAARRSAGRWLNLFDALIAARNQLKNNVSWQWVWDKLLFAIVEGVDEWPR